MKNSLRLLATVLLLIALWGCSQQSVEDGLESEAFTGITLHLNPSASNASDSNDGSQAKPLKTVQAAFDKMIPLKTSGQNVRILIYPGIYREHLVTGAGGQKPENITRPYNRIPDNAAKLVFEAVDKRPGATVFSGSDVWTNWTNNGNGTWSKVWPYNWGAPKKDEKLGGTQAIGEYAARTELVYLNEQRLRQVLKASDLKDNTFFVDEASDRITLKVASGVDVNKAKVEVGVRSRLFYVWNRSNITLDGLTFTHSVDIVPEFAVSFQEGDGRNCANITVSNVFVFENGQGGLEIFCDNTTLRKNIINNNGWGGLGGANAKNWLVEDNITNDNSWRAWQGGYIGWAPAGLKVLTMTDFILRRHQSYGNFSVGVWFDIQNKNITVEDSSIAYNWWNGLFFEASAGPFVARRNTICGNGLSEVVLASVAKVTLEDNKILSNKDIIPNYPYQNNALESVAIMFGEPRRKEPANPFQGIVKAEYPLREITLRNNQIQATGNRFLTASYFNFDNGQEKSDYFAFLDTFRSSGNTWFGNGRDGKPPFQLASRTGAWNTAYDFAGWKTLTGQDSTSQFRNVNLKCF